VSLSLFYVKVLDDLLSDLLSLIYSCSLSGVGLRLIRFGLPAFLLGILGSIVALTGVGFFVGLPLPFLLLY